MTNLKDVLKDRGTQYGNYHDKARFIQEVKELARDSDSWDHLDYDMAESVDMIIHKLSRILFGNPHHRDSWLDIGGYSQLIVDRLDKDDRELDNYLDYQYLRSEASHEDC